MTISVTYPSDVNVVCKFIDDLCNKNELYACFFNQSENAKINQNNLIKIQTSFGSIRSNRGYYACHYYLRRNKTPDDPIVEVQIKTVLHDAWGLKTHDLTYKNPIPIDKNISNNFTVLGDSLSNLDMQSDFLRQFIHKSYAFREATKRAIRIEMIMHGAGSISISEAVSRSSSDPKDYVEMLRRTLDGANALSSADIEKLRRKAIAFCTDVSHECGCTLLCALAVITEDTRAKLDTLERISIWESNEKTKISPKIHKHLANFYFGQLGEAIDAAEHALNYLNSLRRDDIVAQKIYSVISSLSYYYADLIGSDEGAKRGAYTKAIDYRDSLRAHLKNIKIIDDTNKDWAKLIDDLLIKLNSVDSADHKRLSDVFNVIDNAIFVEIQTAKDVNRAKEAIKWLEHLKNARPVAVGMLAELSHALHAHYARTRVLEFEAQAAKHN